MSEEMYHSQNMDKYLEKEQSTMTAFMKVKIQKAIADWDEINEEALYIINFTVSSMLQSPIILSNSAQQA